MALEITLKQLADKLGLELRLSEGTDSNLLIDGCSPLDSSKSTHLSFLANPKYNSLLSSTNAGVVILSPDSLDSCPTNALISDDPYLSFAQAVHLFAPAIKVAADGIDASCKIDKTAKIDPSVCIGPNVVILEGVVISSGVQVGANTVISAGVKIGKNTIIYPNVSICYNVTLGDDIIIHSGCVIGSDGFGIAKDKSGDWLKIPQIGSVIIEDNVEIGSNTCIDRGALGNTHIKSGVKIDNLVQIAHNVIIGENTAIAANSGVAGSAKIGANCLIGGASGINGHISICDNVMLAGMSMVTKSIDEPGMYASGLPAKPQKQWHKQVARFHRIDKLFKKMQDLENKS
jgi:UDP-3-O-[3-hydroxymyristoyl] glucosamine N-acyltransferase